MRVRSRWCVTADAYNWRGHSVRGYARRIGALFIVGPAAGGSIGIRVKQTVRQFKDTTHTPSVLVGIWSPKGTFVSARDAR
jgi:hypothetical protein